MLTNFPRSRDRSRTRLPVPHLSNQTLVRTQRTVTLFVIPLVALFFDEVRELCSAMVTNKCLYRYRLGATPATDVTPLDFFAWCAVSLNTIDLSLNIHYSATSFANTAGAIE